jgi:hypothetical protein
MLDEFRISELEQQVKRHVDRLKLGAMFSGCTVFWEEGDAADMRNVIIEMCDILDTRAPVLIQGLLSKRQEDTGIDDYLIEAGNLLEEIRQSTSYLEIMSPILGMLQQASEPGVRCGWNQKGCRAIMELLHEMLDKIRNALPRLIDKAYKADQEQLPGYRKSV